jgi:nucleotide-binding universal stress UspA family protein
VRGPIVVGSDGSETSRLAIEEAAAIAKGNDQSVVAVFVRHTPLKGFAISSGGLNSAEIQEAIDVGAALAESHCIAILEPACVPWRFEVRTGKPLAELMRVAVESDSDAIVVAGKRHGAFGRYLSGSVCRGLLHRWPRTLIVIRPRK